MSEVREETAGEYLRRVINESGKSIAKVAREADTSPSVIDSVLTGRRNLGVDLAVSVGVIPTRNLQDGHWRTTNKMSVSNIVNNAASTTGGRPVLAATSLEADAAEKLVEAMKLFESAGLLGETWTFSGLSKSQVFTLLILALRKQEHRKKRTTSPPHISGK